MMARLIDQGISKGNWSVVMESVWWMVGFSLFGFLFALGCQYFASIASQGFGTEVRSALFAKIQQLSHEDLNRFGSDTLITRLTNDVNQTQLAIAMLIRLVVRAPFLSIGAVIMAFTIDSTIGWLFLGLLPVFCLLIAWLMVRSVPLYKLVQQSLDALNARLSQHLSGVRVIRAFARGNTEIHQVNATTDEVTRVYLRVNQLSALLTPATTLLINLGVVAVFYFGGFKVNTGQLAAGEVLALVNYMNQMLLALIIVSNLVVLFTRAEASAKRIDDVLQLEPSLVDSANAYDGKIKGTVTFSDVSFRYHPNLGRALKDLSFTIEEGQFFAITGPTGAGKSTLIQLLPRFYDVTNGCITIDGQAVRSWATKRLRQDIALVPQRAVLFQGTIRSNLLWGKPAATEADCWRALEFAQAADFVRALPEQLDAPVTEGGTNFSGGQKQRLTIARALIKEPAILILDDSLSALDSQTDAALRTVLRSLPITVVLISQRVAALQDADQILVLSHGKNVGCGTHEELLATCSLYQALIAAQDGGVSNEG